MGARGLAATPVSERSGETGGCLPRETNGMFHRGEVAVQKKSEVRDIRLSGIFVAKQTKIVTK